MAKWIPTVERMPGKNMIGEKVLITVDDSVMLAIVPRALNFGRGFLNFEYCDIEAGEQPIFYHAEDVSAWMRLPVPYKERNTK